MNERIRELAEQILTNQKEFFVGDPKDWGYMFSGEELEKFAQLIVRECISAAVSAQHGQTFGVDRRVHWNNGIAEAVDMIVERFGVEE